MEPSDEQAVKAEMQRGQFVRAAMLAEAAGLSQEEIRELRVKALWQMAAVNRNMSGTRLTAEKFALSKGQTKEILAGMAREHDEKGLRKAIEPCYDHPTGKYLDFNEWLDLVVKKWDRLK